MNHCSCGFYPDRQKCRCTERQIIDYRNKVSHPIMDRIDIRIEVRPVKARKLLGEADGERSEVYRQRIEAARSIQLNRYRARHFILIRRCPSER